MGTASLVSEKHFHNLCFGVSKDMPHALHLLDFLEGCFQGRQHNKGTSCESPGGFLGEKVPEELQPSQLSQMLI